MLQTIRKQTVHLCPVEIVTCTHTYIFISARNSKEEKKSNNTHYAMGVKSNFPFKYFQMSCERRKLQKKNKYKNLSQPRTRRI